MKKKNWNQMGCPRSYDIERATKTNWEGEFSRQVKRGLGKNMVK
jgi:hypothetical protein